MKTISGQCYCGDFQFTITGEIDAVSICHCNMCRQQSGADYTTWIPVGTECFNANRDLVDLDKFSVSERSKAYFCKVCHTKLLSRDTDYLLVYGIPRGLFRSDNSVEHSKHFFWGHRAPWLDASDDAQKYGGETGFEKVDRRPSDRELVIAAMRPFTRDTLGANELRRPNSSTERTYDNHQ